MRPGSSPVTSNPPFQVDETYDDIASQGKR